MQVKFFNKTTSAKKSHGLGRLRPVLTFIVIILGILLAMSVFFKVSKIEVEGNSYYTKTQIVQASGIEKGDNLFFVNRLSSVSKMFAKLPYIQKVEITRTLPNKVIISVTESQELAYIKVDDVYWAIDSNCKILEKLDKDKASSLIKVSGITLKKPTIGKIANAEADDTAKITYLADVLNEIQGRELSADIKYIDFSNVSNPTFDYLGRFTVKLGSYENIEYKFGMLISAVSQLEEGDYGTIDLSVDNQAHYSPN